MSGFPAWSALSAGNMKVLRVPASVELVTILADRDDKGTGLEAAQALAARLRLQGKTVDVRLPRVGKDPNAVLLARRASNG